MNDILMSGSLRGVLIGAQPFILAPKLPAAIRDYTLPVPYAVGPAVHSIVAASVAVAPWGSGELQISDLVVAEAGLTFTEAGGQPSRTYTFRILAILSNGRIYEFTAKQTITAELDSDQPQAVRSAGFGPPIAWGTPGPTLDTLAINLAALAGGAAYALPLPADINVFTTVPMNGGAILTAGDGLVQTVFNRCGTGQELLVFPSAGMAIETQAIDSAVSIADGDQATFLNDSTSFLLS